MNDVYNKSIGWKQKIKQEMAAYLENVIYLAIFFCVFTNYQRLIHVFSGTRSGTVQCDLPESEIMNQKQYYI